ncbi:uncharacterized protein AMSG_00684 [Thecamonas trahens ATCC 50062]|uniref:ABC3 transporter permease C-terminal domain-containing protein n=1 Tax=Thecamonas trahens ATCC 50062 TaxID=461836 RepID=A0A0L0DGR6_THETB|nr:hypothetical protein AMSG_00684 [Thecamonas trahens ATCC 50062]KNC50523.1 hypothetical protein AMSG_00684 [Thecamonas trahens ATCC 50062]|eukprot:XP_013762415.1 hypothetical protein AMSG_00684 [Thecamonas trahens ATCC 50062]
MQSLEVEPHGAEDKVGRAAFGSWRAQSRFLVGHTCATVCSSKLNYCLGFSACMLVVFVSAVVMSVLSNAPVVFLRLSEAEVGEIDLQLVSAGWTGASLLNYTTVKEDSLSSAIGEAYTFHSPRVKFQADIMALSDCHPRAAAAAAASARHPFPSQWSYEPSSLTAPVCNDEAIEAIDPGRKPGPDGVVRRDPAKTCLQVLCSSEYTPLTQASVYAIDSAAEVRMGLGRAYTFGVIPPSSVLLHKNLATILGVSVGDTTYVSLSVRTQAQPNSVFRHFFQTLVDDDTAARDAFLNSTAYTNASEPWTSSDLANAFPYAEGKYRLPWAFRINLPLTVAGILPSSLGKFAASDTQAALVELGTLATALADALNANTTELQDVRSMLGASSMAEFASEINVNLPPPRIDPYLSSDFDTIQKNVLRFTSKVVYALGFNQLDADEPIVENLRATRFFSLFLGLILNIVIFILSGLSVLLIYSLLMVNVETRTFEMGTMRMLGMTKAGVVQLFLLQAFAYALPAYVVGMGVSQLAFYLLANLFESSTDVSISPWLSPAGIILATVLGLTIPVISALAPIRTALGVSLVAALQVSRSKQSAVKISLERNEDGKVSWALVVTGSTLAVFGFLVYYLLPLALLSFNLTLLLNIFFGLLIGMLLGLALLALNFQHMIERLLVFSSSRGGSRRPSPLSSSRTSSPTSCATARRPSCTRSRSPSSSLSRSRSRFKSRPLSTRSARPAAPA